jgi:ferredoxin
VRVRVDREKCQGHGRCHAVAADVFAVDEYGYSLPLDGPVAAGLEDAAQRGAAACPERAITIVPKAEPTDIV